MGQIIDTIASTA